MPVLSEVWTQMGVILGKRVSEVRPKFNRWERQLLPVPNEAEADELIAAYEAVSQIPKTWEAQAHWLAMQAIQRHWAPKDIPEEFRAEVKRLLRRET